MTTPVEEAVIEQDVATERLAPVAAYAIASAGEAVAEAPDIDHPVPEGIAEAIHLIVVAALVSLAIAAVQRHRNRPDAPPPPDQDEIEETAGQIAPEITDTAWQWAVRYQRSLLNPPDDEPGTRSKIAPTPDEESRAMARTLATRLAAESSLATAHLLNMPFKVWISRGNPSVRSTHRRLHGEGIPMDAPFRRWPTGEVLDFPGDPRAPLRETANCRCKIIFSPTLEGVDEALRPADLEEAFTIAASLESRWEDPHE